MNLNCFGNCSQKKGMIMRKLINSKLAAALVLLAVFTGSLKAETASVLLQQGIYAEETEGDLKKAIDIYRQLLGEEKGLRALAAQAQYRLAIFEQQGKKKTSRVST
jgi:hypothetical protein